METADNSGNPSNAKNTIDAIGFIVNERAIAVYDPQLEERSIEFIRSFDADFWRHQFQISWIDPNSSSITHDHVSSLRLLLSHAEEHLFALIFAFLQAPQCPDLWLYHYKPSDLPIMVEKVRKGETVLTRFNLKETNWANIMNAIWPGLDENRCRLNACVTERLAEHFISTHGRDEYNGLKHGLRLRFGGTRLSFSPGGSPDKTPDPDSFIPLGGSSYGSHFYVFEALPGLKGHFKVKSRFSNWDLNEILVNLRHAIMLIENIGVAFRAYSGIEGNLQFQFFSKDDTYENDPRKSKGVTIGQVVSHFSLEKSELISLEDVRKAYS